MSELMRDKSFEYGELAKAVDLLKKLNVAIDALYTLADWDYATGAGGILESSVIAIDRLEKKGINKAWVEDAVEKLEFLRTTLYAEHLDWNWLATVWGEEVDEFQKIKAQKAQDVSSNFEVKQINPHIESEC